jgi:hypothetical protein
LRCCGFRLGPADDPSAIGSIGGCRAAVTVWVSDLPAPHWAQASKMIVWPGSSPSVAARAAFASLVGGGGLLDRLASVTPTCLRRASKFARLRSWEAVRAERGGSSDVRRCLVAGERRGWGFLRCGRGFNRRRRYLVCNPLDSRLHGLGELGIALGEWGCRSPAARTAVLEPAGLRVGVDAAARSTSSSTDCSHAACLTIALAVSLRLGLASITASLACSGRNGFPNEGSSARRVRGPGLRSEQAQGIQGRGVRRPRHRLRQYSELQPSEQMRTWVL